MPTICGAAAFAVAAAFLVWRAVAQARQRRERLLRLRVAYMLWVVAALDESAAPWHVSWGSADH
jgi:hypothetical protein